LFTCTLFVSCVAARAENYYFIGLSSGGTASFEQASNWSGGVAPGVQDTAWILDDDALDRSITLETGATTKDLMIGNSGGGETTLWQTGDMTLSREFLGVGLVLTPELHYVSSSRGVHVQNSGTNNVEELWLADYNSYQAPSSGRYVLNGGTLNVGDAWVGNAGHGTFEQNTGVVEARNLWLSYMIEARSTYALNAGTLHVTGSEYIGWGAVGTFIQSGGTHIVEGVLSFAQTNGSYSFGTYILKGADATFITDTELIARHGAGGKFVQSAGVHEVRRQCIVGYQNDASYELSGGRFSVLGELDFGYATMNQTGGAVEVGTVFSNGGVLWISSYAVYDLVSEVGSVQVWGDEYVRGTFNQTAGGHSVSANLYVQGSKGTYSISGGALSTPLLNIASGGRFDWSGGALSLDSLLLAGRMNVAAGSGRTLIATNVEIDRGTGRLDLADNHMIVDYLPAESPDDLLDKLRQDLRAGALFTSLNTNGHQLALADNSILEKPSFASVTFPPGDFTQLLVMYTYAGDSNLDGVVDLMDLSALASHWQTLSDWVGGDFDYSGFVDVADLGVLASNWQVGMDNRLGPTLDDALSALGLPAVPVPEPFACVPALGMALLTITCRFGSASLRRDWGIARIT
jgi:hypothetical protein